MKLINIGFGNAVNADRILAVAGPESAPIKRIVQEAKEQKMLIDATQGRKNPSRHNYRQQPCYINLFAGGDHYGSL